MGNLRFECLDMTARPQLMNLMRTFGRVVEGTLRVGQRVRFLGQYGTVTARVADILVGGPPLHPGGPPEPQGRGALGAVAECVLVLDEFDDPQVVELLHEGGPVGILNAPETLIGVTLPTELTCLCEEHPLVSDPALRKPDLLSAPPDAVVPLEIQLDGGLGPIEPGMHPAQVRALLPEPHYFEPWMGGNLDDSLLYRGLVLEFSSSDGSEPPPDSHLVAVRLRAGRRPETRLLGRELRHWTRQSLLAELLIRGIAVGPAASDEEALRNAADQGRQFEEETTGIIRSLHAAGQLPFVEDLEEYLRAASRSSDPFWLARAMKRERDYIDIGPWRVVFEGENGIKSFSR